MPAYVLILDEKIDVILFGKDLEVVEPNIFVWYFYEWIIDVDACNTIL
ncbi:hypothetical protein SynRS9907_00825 [Synechococcus sp. RS9907]|nr:hypothetical protein SynRS9907_00825 [Synechococcus sp. RS9907]